MIQIRLPHKLTGRHIKLPSGAFSYSWHRDKKNSEVLIRQKEPELTALLKEHKQNLHLDHQQKRNHTPQAYVSTAPLMSGDRMTGR